MKKLLSILIVPALLTVPARLLLIFPLLLTAQSFATTISSPSNGSTVGTSVAFAATADRTSCAQGIASMGIYVDNALKFVVRGTNLSTSLTFGAGTYRSVVQAWDYCGGAAPSKAITFTVRPPDSSLYVSTERATQADAFVDSIGINTHLTYTDTLYYTQWSTILSELQSSGIRHVRDGFYDWPSSSVFVTRHQALASAGIKTDYVVPLSGNTTSSVLQSFSSRVKDMEAIEAPNECDAGTNCGGGGTVGINNVVAFLPTLTAAGSALNLPVLAPSFTLASSYIAAGDLSSKVTYNNLHVYFGGRNPESTGWGDSDSSRNGYGSLAWWLDQGNVDAANVTSMITESGYISYSKVNAPYTIPTSVEASYIPRTLLLAYNKGVKRTYMYEMIDEVSSVGYGLLAADLSEKPAFTAVKNLIGVLTDAGSTFTAGSLSYSIAGASSSLNHTLLQKRDGSFWLVLWSEQSSYNPATNSTVAVIPQTINLICPGSVKPKQVITLNKTGALTSTRVSGRSNSIELSISDQVTIVQID